MNVEFKSWTEETYDDFLQVVRSCFADVAIPVVERLFSNPLRSINPAAGDIAYVDGVPRVVQAAVLRRLFYRQLPYNAVVGSTLGAVKGTSPALLLDLIELTIAPRSGSVLFYGNTACPAAFKMNRLLGVDGDVPDSCQVTRSTYIWSVAIFPYVVRKVAGRFITLKEPNQLPPPGEWSCAFKGGFVVRRMMRFESAEYENFWSEYLKHNEGLVSSRTASELTWVYGDRLDRGSIVALGLYRDNALVGHIVLAAEHKAAQVWKVSDWIAIGNDLTNLSLLLRGAKRFLAKKTRAVVLSSSGFPMWVQDVVRKELPRTLSGGDSGVVWKFTDEKSHEMVGDLSKSNRSWFFGPYDGDMALTQGGA